MVAARARRVTEAANSAYSSAVWTNRPRCPELPPDTRTTYSPSSSAGSVTARARCRSTRSRLSRRSVVAASKCSIMSALVITGSRARSASSNRSGSTPRSRAAWKGELAMARASSARSRSRWHAASCPESQPRRAMASGIRRPMAPDTRVRSRSRSVIVAVVIFPPGWASAAPRSSRPAGAAPARQGRRGRPGRRSAPGRGRSRWRAIARPAAGARPGGPRRSPC